VDSLYRGRKAGFGAAQDEERGRGAGEGDTGEEEEIKTRREKPMFTKEITETKTVIDTDKISTYDGIIAEVEYTRERITLVGIVLSVYADCFKLAGFELGKRPDDRSILVSVSAEDLASGTAKVKHIERAEKSIAARIYASEMKNADKIGVVEA